jgi:hypothetical protein
MCSGKEAKMEKGLEQITSEINPEILKAFHTMWDIFPFPVLLLRKDRTILDCNKAAKDKGVRLGGKCFQLSGEDDIHKHCLGNAALKEGTAKRTVSYSAVRKQVLDSYWLPLSDGKDLFVHFAIDITEYAKPELSQEP